MEIDTNVRLNSGVGWFSARSSKVSLLIIASILFENRSYRTSMSSVLFGKLDGKLVAFPSNASVRNFGVSFMILFFMSFILRLLSADFIKKEAGEKSFLRSRES